MFSGYAWWCHIVPIMFDIYVRMKYSRSLSAIYGCKCKKMCTRVLSIVLCYQGRRYEGTYTYQGTTYMYLHNHVTSETVCYASIFSFSSCLQFMCSCSQFSSILKPWPWLLLPTLWLHPLLPWLLNKIHPLCN